MLLDCEFGDGEAVEDGEEEGREGVGHVEREADAIWKIIQGGRAED